MWLRRSWLEFMRSTHTLWNMTVYDVDAIKVRPPLRPFRGEPYLRPRRPVVHGRGGEKVMTSYVLWAKEEYVGNVRSGWSGSAWREGIDGV